MARSFMLHLCLILALLLSPCFLTAQDRQGYCVVSGVVTDGSKEPLAGASVPKRDNH